ncbi:MAG: hypothetical protein QF721_10640 [Verrucomicrobiota bacterium]|jgi:hypothetical protein|nr:hypothetical protein [Verrucomicrobiota bacterium]MDP7049900.1 hypothetical protein [Verrucomicrobiota bacterium]
MQLDETQKKTVAGWVEEGLDLSAIQSRLESEMDIRMTYMDVRFLVGDLELTPKDEEEPEAAEPAVPQDEPAVPADDAPTPDNPFPASEEPVGDPPLEADSVNPDGEVSVTVSPVTQPGTMASGSVTFSDGVTCDWHVDQFGRPALVPPSDGYRPPEADMPKFGQKLQQELRGGF